MGYIVVDHMGNITQATAQYGTTPGTIYLNDAVLFNAILANTTDYKWINQQIEHHPIPNDYSSWNGTAWVTDSALLTEAQNNVWEGIKEFRDAAYSYGCAVGDHLYHTDIDSKLKYLGLLTYGENIPADVMWKTMSGEMVLMTPTLIQAIFHAVAVFEATVFGTGEYHKAAMLQAADPNSYDYTVGWPAQYE